MYVGNNDCISKCSAVIQCKETCVSEGAIMRKYPWLCIALSAMLMVANACSDDQSRVEDAVELCGNGRLDVGEACDKELFRDDAKVCSEGQQEVSDAIWKCSDTCEVDESYACASAGCNDGSLGDDEVCDGSLFADNVKVCPDGMEEKDGGVWACTSTCRVDTASVCQKICGNGRLNDGEACDGVVFADGAQVCPDNMNLLESPVWSCSDSCTVNTSKACQRAAGTCAVVDLTTPSSSDSSLKVTNSDGEVVIKVIEQTCVELTGTYDGLVKIKNPNNYDLTVVLNNISITSQSHDGQLKLNNSSLCQGNTYTLELVGQNTIVGSANEAAKKVLKCESNLNITGSGTLDITAKYKTGIGVDDVLTFDGGTVNVTVARTTSNSEKGFGIKVVNGFIMNDGQLNIKARDNMTYYEARGLKVDGYDAVAEDDEDYDEWNTDACQGYGAGKGYIHIHGGKIDIDSDAKAMVAGWKQDEDAVTSSTSDDPTPNIMITGGSIKLTTHTQPRESGNGGGPGGGPGGGRPGQPGSSSSSSSSDTDISPEGLEAKNDIVISGGELLIDATDDAVNAANALTISGGKIVAISANNDAIDSNKSFVISGGLIAALAASSPEQAFDVIEGGSIQYQGGTIIGLGGAQGGGFGGSSGNNDFSLSKGAYVQSAVSSVAGKTFALTASDNTSALAAIKVPSDYSVNGNIMFIHENLVSGTSYALYSNATVTPDASSSWFGDILLDNSGEVSGTTVSSVKATK